MHSSVGKAVMPRNDYELDVTLHRPYEWLSLAGELAVIDTLKRAKF